VGASKLSANLADGSAALPENMSVGIGDGVERLHEELDEGEWGDELARLQQELDAERALRAADMANEHDLMDRIKELEEEREKQRQIADAMTNAVRDHHQMREARALEIFLARALSVGQDT